MNNRCSFDVEVHREQIADYARLSGDSNPLHVDEAYAKTTDFGRPIAHGAFLLGFVSRVLGMHLPGSRSLLLSLKARFPKPLFYPTSVRVSGNLKAFHPGRETGVVNVQVTDLGKSWLVLDAEATFALHESNGSVSAPRQDAVPYRKLEAGGEALPGTRWRLLVTGATGGVGSALLSSLSPGYEMVCLTRRPHASSREGRWRYAQVDLEEESAFDRFLAENSPSDFYGILHLSVPPMTRAFISDDLAAARRHLYHSVEVPLKLVQWARRPKSAIQRVILLGSTGGSKFPQPQQGAYSLAKAALEHLARLLTADLSAQGATVNVIAPGIIPVGLNEGISRRARAVLEGKVPTQRLLEVRDVANLVLFLLSEAASQINGTTIDVDGGFSE